jgi:hypothetical protein
MFQLYQLYLSKGMLNEKLALEWLLSAAAAGHTVAAEATGIYSMNRDEELARFWLAKAPASASAKKALAGLGKEKQATGEDYITRLVVALAKTGVAAK